MDLCLGHTSVILLDKLLCIFGGRGQRNRLNDLHVLDLTNMKWLKVNRVDDSSGPEARSIHTLTAICPNK